MVQRPDVLYFKLFLRYTVERPFNLEHWNTYYTSTSMSSEWVELNFEIVREENLPSTIK